MGLKRANVNLLPHHNSSVSLWAWERDVVGDCLISGRQWGPHILDSMYRHIKPGSVFIDVGAHVGFYSLAALRFGAAWVLSYEPSFLWDVLRINSVGYPMTTVGMALGSEPGIAKWRSTVHGTFTGTRPRPDQVFGLGRIGGLSLSHSTDRSDPERVRVTTLDEEYLGGIEPSGIPISFIKIDAQGWDLKVLKGGRKLIKEHRPVITFEYEADLSEEGLQEYLGLFQLLDYEVTKIEGTDDYEAIPR